MKKNAMGNGATQCVLCADEFGILGASPLLCNDCKKAVCTKCGVDTLSAHKEPICLCKICAETREFGLAIHQNDHQARRRFVEWAQNEIAVVPDFHKRILFSDEAHFWLNGYVNKQNCRIWSEANPQVYVETPLHPEKLTVWCALWAGGILLQKR
ncbi:rab effector Noc2 [Trichonephila clavipes]|nr:rab effector Noc2 [Trichonephila clavipes]